MDNLYLEIEANIEKIIKLRQEIVFMKEELKKMDINLQPELAGSLEKDINLASSELQRLENEVARSGAAIGSRMQQILDSVDFGHMPIEHIITTLEAVAGEYEKTSDKMNESEQYEAHIRAVAELKAHLGGYQETYDLLNQKAEEYLSKMQALNAEKERMIQSGGMGTSAYDEVIEKISEVEIQYHAVREEQEDLTVSGQNYIQGMINGCSGLVDVLSSANGVLSLFSGSNEKLLEVQRKIETAINVTNAVMSVSNALSATAAFRTQTLTTLTKAFGVAQTWLATKLGVSTVMAQALMATLTLGLSVAITAIVTLIDRYITKQKEEKAAQEEAIEATKRRAEEERKVQQSMASSVSGQVVDYKRLQEAYNELGDDMDKKKKFIRDNQSEFNKLGISVNSILDAENLFVNNEQAFIQSLTNRALAAAAMKMAEEDYTKAIQAMMDVENHAAGEEKRKQAKAESSQWSNSGAEKGGKGVFAGVNPNEGQANEGSWMRDVGKEFDDIFDQKIAEGLKNKADAFYQSGTKKIEVAAQFSAKSNQNLEKANLTPSTGGSSSSSSYDKDALERRALERIRADKDLEFEVERARIATLKEGGQKVLDTIKLNNKREIEEIKRKRDDRIKAEEESFKKDPGNKNKTYDPSTTKAKYDELIEHTEKRQATEGAEKVSSYNNKILDKYQTYYDKLLSVQQKYEEDRKALKEAGGTQEHFNQLSNKEQEEVDAINEEFAMRESTFVAWANNIANQGIDELRKMLVEAERELERQKFLNPKDKKTAVAESKVNTLQRTIGEKETKTNTDPKKQSLERWNKLKTALSGVSKEFGSLGKEIGGTVGEVMSAAGEIAGSTFTMIDGITKLATSSVTVTENTAQGASKSMQAVEKASVILAIIGAAFQIMNKLKSFFGPDTKDYDKAKEAYEDYIKVLDRVIEKQKELLGTMSGENAKKSYEYAISLIKKSEDAARTLGKKYLDSGASSGFLGIDSKASKGVDQRKKITNEAWNEAKAALGGSFNANKLNEGRMTGLFDLTIKQLNDLQTQAPLFWSQLHEDTKKYLEDILEAGESAEELLKTLKESLTGVSFDELKDSLDELVKDAELTFQEIQESFEGHMSNAILNFVKNEIMQKELKAWYDKFANAMDDGVLTKNEAENLQKEYERIAREANQNYINAMTAAGLTVEGEETSQESTKKGFETMSQDTAEELNGRFTMLQMAGEEVKAQSVLQTEILAQNSSRLDAMLATGTEQVNIANETRDMIVSSYLELQGIRENTGAIIKPINNMSDKLDNIERKIQTL